MKVVNLIDGTMPGMSCHVRKSVGGCSTSVDDEVLVGVILIRFLTDVEG